MVGVAVGVAHIIIRNLELIVTHNIVVGNFIRGLHKFPLRGKFSGWSAIVILTVTFYHDQTQELPDINFIQTNIILDLSYFTFFHEVPSTNQLVHVEIQGSMMSGELCIYIYTYI